MTVQTPAAVISCRTSASRLAFPSVSIAEYALKPAEIKTVTTLATSPQSPHVELERTQAQWRSVWSPDSKNLQGDPRNMIIILGENTAKNFEIEMLSANRMRAPRGYRYNQRIVLANRFLHSRGQEVIPVRFVDSSSDQPVARFEYINGTIHLILPVSASGHFLIHDIAVHYGALLLPRILLVNAAQKSFLFSRFAKRLEKSSENLSPQVRELIVKINNVHIHRHESRVDAMTGNISIQTVDRILGFTQAHDTKKLESDVLQPMTGITGEKFLHEWVMDLLSQMEVLRQNPDIDLNAAAAQILDVYSAVQKSLPQDMKTPLEYSADELIRFVDQRRLELSLWDGK